MGNELDRRTFLTAIGGAAAAGSALAQAAAKPPVIGIQIGSISFLDEGTEKVLDIGPIEATTKHRKTIPIPPLAGGAIVAAGVILVIAGTKAR